MADLPLPVLPPVDEDIWINSNYVLYWNGVALDLNRLSVTIGGPLSGPPGSARGLGILHLAIHDAFFAIRPQTGIKTYLDPHGLAPLQLPDHQGAKNAKEAVVGAAYTVLSRFYATPSPAIATKVTNALKEFVQKAHDSFSDIDTLSEDYRFGVNVGSSMLDLLHIRPEDPAFNQGTYKPPKGDYKFDDDPTNPVHVVPVDPNDPTGPQKTVHIYHLPYYGLLGKRLSVQHHLADKNGKVQPTYHVLADPPVGFSQHDLTEYQDATHDVYLKGGSPDQASTTRTSAQRVTGYTWAYDGAILLGTPPRAYNLILRRLAWSMRKDPQNKDPNNDATTADFVRLFALCNVSAADAGIFAWQEKYRFEFWRPLSGLREEGFPFYTTLGAPHTNSNDISFKPPFPSYPSGHATFGGAFFQAARLHFSSTRDLKDKFMPDEPDKIAFKWVSEELNGVSRDLRQPYDPTLPISEQVGTVRTRVERTFESLWEAMFDNAISRLYLGVHWPFDAFASKDVATGQKDADGCTVYKATKDIRYVTTGPRGDVTTADKNLKFPIGGVPLGIDIANDIFQGGLQPTPAKYQPSGLYKQGDFVSGKTKIDAVGIVIGSDKAVDGAGKTVGAAKGGSGDVAQKKLEAPVNGANPPNRQVNGARA